MDIKAEEYLWNEMEKGGHGNPFPRDVINEMVKKGIIKSPKQAWRTLEKWDKKGIYNYGCKIDLGWKEKKETPEWREVRE